MKKTLLFIGAIALTMSGLNAQITINQTDVVGNWEIVKQAEDTIPSASLSVGNAGASQTWDISGLVTEHTVDSLNFIGPGGTPGEAIFPMANMCLTFGVSDSSWIYLLKDATGLYMIGQTSIEMGTQLDLPFPGTIIEFPSTMGSSFSEVSTTDVFSIEVGFDPDGPGPHGTVDSIKVVNTTDKTATMDGWGDAITPMGTFPSIRQNEVTTETDTVFMLVGGSWLMLSPEMETLLGFSAVEVSTDYRMAWWSNDPSARFPVMEMSHDNAGTVYNVTWLKEAPSADVVEWDAITNLEVYPNPATTNINFNVVSENGGIVVVRDLTGAKVATSALDQSGTTLSVENFNNGMYFYTVILSNGSIAKNGKFVVKK